MFNLVFPTLLAASPACSVEAPDSDTDTDTDTDTSPADPLFEYRFTGCSGEPEGAGAFVQLTRSTCSPGADGVADGAPTFNGTSAYGTVADTALLDGGAEGKYFAVSIDVLMTGSAEPVAYFVNKEDQNTEYPEGSGWALRTDDFGSTATFEVYTAETLDGTGPYVQVPFDFLDGSWHHVVASFSDGEAAVAIDGATYNEQALEGNYHTVNPNSWPMTIGKNAAVDTRYFEGSVDNLRFYDHDLTRDQMMSGNW